MELATVLNNLALHYHSARKPEQAEPLYLEAIATAERAPHPNQLDIAVMYNNLGQLYAEARRYRDADAAYAKSLAAMERILGGDHPRVAVVLHNYGDLLQEEGEMERAAAAYERSRRILEARLGPDHPNVATSLISSARLLAATGHPEEAAARARARDRDSRGGVRCCQPEAARTAHQVCRPSAPARPRARGGGGRRASRQLSLFRSASLTNSRLPWTRYWRRPRRG